MPKLVTALDGQGFPSPSDRLMRHGADLTAHAMFFLAMSGTIWVLGQWYRFLHGEGGEWISGLLIGHPFALTAATYAIVGVMKLLGIEPRDRHAEVATPVADEPATLVEDARIAAGGRTPDLARAYGLLVRAHAAGSAAAAFALGDWAARGVVVERDRARANALYREAAAGGVPHAVHALAASHENGWDMPVDTPAAYHGYLRAALLGCDDAALDVARCLREGIGTPADAESAAAWQEASRLRAGTTGRWAGGVWPWGRGGVGAD